MSQIFVRMVTMCRQSYRTGYNLGMSGIRWQRGAAVLALVGMVGITGCYDWIPIKPTEIPKLVADAEYLEQPDGTRVRFDEQADGLKVRWRDETRKFWAPRVNIQGGVLAISGDNAPPVQIPVDEIVDVRAGRLNVIETAGAISICGAVVALLALLLARDKLYFRGS
jgi:hypothetical protein